MKIKKHIGSTIELETKVARNKSTIIYDGMTFWYGVAGICNTISFQTRFTPPELDKDIKDAMGALIRAWKW